MRKSRFLLEQATGCWRTDSGVRINYGNWNGLLEKEKKKKSKIPEEYEFFMEYSNFIEQPLQPMSTYFPMKLHHIRKLIEEILSIEIQSDIGVINNTRIFTSHSVEYVSKKEMYVQLQGLIM